jgi:hypothetical protein
MIDQERVPPRDRPRTPEAAAWDETEAFAASIPWYPPLLSNEPASLNTTEKQLASHYESISDLRAQIDKIVTFLAVMSGLGVGAVVEEIVSGLANEALGIITCVAAFLGTFGGVRAMLGR